MARCLPTQVGDCIPLQLKNGVRLSEDRCFLQKDGCASEWEDRWTGTENDWKITYNWIDTLNCNRLEVFINCLDFISNCTWVGVFRTSWIDVLKCKWKHAFKNDQLELFAYIWLDVLIYNLEHAITCNCINEKHNSWIDVFFSQLERFSQKQLNRCVHRKLGKYVLISLDGCFHKQAIGYLRSYANGFMLSKTTIEIYSCPTARLCPKTNLWLCS